MLEQSFTDIAAYESLDLVLYDLCLPQETFINGQSAYLANARPNEVCLGISISLDSFQQIFRVSPDVDTLSLYFGEAADSQSLGGLGHISQCNLWGTFSDHQMNHDKGFEDDGPCRVAQTQL